MMKKGMIGAAVAALCTLLLASHSFAASAEEIKQVVEKVQKAVALVQKEGDAAYPKLSDPKGEFVSGSLYVFVFSLKPEDTGVLTAHLKPAMVGKSLLALKEPETNRKFAQEFVTIAESPAGKGWTEYKWAKPDAREIAIKATYLMKVPGKPLAVGAGIYDVTKAEAEKVAP